MRHLFISIIIFYISLTAKVSIYDSLFVNSAICDSALSYLNASKKDLFFPVKTGDYPLVFPLIDRLFKDQPQQIKAAEEFAGVCQEFPNPDFAIIYREFGCPRPKLDSISSIDQFLQIVKAAETTRDSAWLNCSATEKELIIKYFRQGQSYRLLKESDNDSYNFKQDELGQLFADRIAEREAWQITHDFFGKTLKKIRPEYFIKSGIILYQALLDLQNKYTSNPEEFVAGTTETAFGRVTVGTKLNDSYTGSYLLILDPDGDDTYNLNCDSLPFQFIIDQQGNDLYQAERNGSCIAFNGVSLLFDLTGNDCYRGSDNSNCAVTLGFAALLDGGGNDQYLSGTYGQAASQLGFALLWDKSGSDRYLASAQAQGYAGCYGISILCDESGNDSYLAVSQQVDELRYADHFNSMSQGFAIGERDHSGGGIALLYDKCGNDLYQSDIFGQGAGYWLSLGILIDADGHDSYLSYQYTQGAGVHLAFGTLLDYAGNDLYRAKGVSMGCGHDYAGGVLIDMQGDDSYLAESLSIGSGNADGLSIFFDMSGSDLYDTKEKSCLGYSDWRRDTGYLGIFVDNGGLDRYTAAFAGNKKVWYNGTWGAGIDK